MGTDRGHASRDRYAVIIGSERLYACWARDTINPGWIGWMAGWRIHGCLIVDRREAAVDNGEVDGLPLLECRGAIAHFLVAAHFATVCLIVKCCLDFRFGAVAIPTSIASLKIENVLACAY